MSSITPLELPFTIRGFDCGYGGHFRPLALANLFQEAAALNADTLGFGASDMDARKLTWMLSRLDIRVDREPREGERVIVRTWPAGFERLFALRDFELIGEGSDKPIARASYAYLVVDLQARRPLRAQNVISPDALCERPRAISNADFTVSRPDASETWTESYRQTAMERHIDHNGHVNNAHLIAWLCDAPPAAKRGTGGLAALSVEFSLEALQGDELSAVWAELPALGGSPRQSCELRRGAEVCARAELSWR
ncbi:MAG TPA: hypothetical protein DCG47_14280 [Spirochaetaceae bacterium]|nr:hypothetical protein [Spirochaetaceae bacterium]